MSRFMGPDESAQLWYGSSSKKRKKLQEPRQTIAAEQAANAGKGFTVNVGLFGYLATLTDKTHVTLHFPAAAKVGDVVEAVGEACGAKVQAAIEDGSNGLAKCCRIFVDGVILHDVNSSLSPAGGQAEMEIIILMANEAG